MDADQIEDRGLEHVTLDETAEGAVVVPTERDLRPPDVLLYKPRQVGGVHAVGEVVLVHLQQVVGPLCVVVA